MPTRQVREWQAGQALNRAPNGIHFGFHYSLNPYRGCAHACRYCYARESHRYLDLNLADDFETRLFAKENLPRRLEAELKKIPVSRQIAIGTVTDPYQPLESRHRLTEEALKALTESGHPFTVTTKSPLILRDLELLTVLGRRRQIAVNISLITLDKALLRILEPATAPPARRLETIRRLRAADIPVGLFLAPIIPGLTDRPGEIEELATAAIEAGATWVMAAPARLSPPLKAYFLNRLRETHPESVQMLASLYEDRQTPPAAYYDRLRRRIDPVLTRHGVSPKPLMPVAYEIVRQTRFVFE